jgi:DNA modification methylase
MINSSTEAPITQNPCYTQPFFRLLNKDSFLAIKEIEDNSIDLIVTDPPYGIQLTKKSQGANELVAGDDGFSVMIFVDELMREFKRILKPSGAIYLFTRFDVLPYWWIKMKNHLVLKNHIIWYKKGGGMGDLYRTFSFNYESIIYATKSDEHKIRGKRDGSVWEIGKVKPEFHQTEKPVKLIEKIIEHSSDKGMVIFDPFMGGGTTGVACKNLNRSFIGIEMVETIFLIAKSRIETHCPQGTMFP